MKTGFVLQRFALCAAAAGLAVGAASAQVAYVDGVDPTCGSNFPCYPTIQSAVSAQPDGATIIVRPGVYREDYFTDPNITPDPNADSVRGLWLYKNLQTIKSIDGSANDGSPDTIIECPEPWIPYGGVRITGTGNTLQGFQIVDRNFSGHEHPHYLVKVEGDNNSVFDSLLIGRGAGNREDRGVLLQGEIFSTGGGDGLAFFNNVKRNEIYDTCYSIDVADAEPARIQDQSGIECNTLHDDCKAISIRLSCDLLATLPDPNNPLRPIRYNNIGYGQFSGLQVEYQGTCDPLIDAVDNWWSDPSGPNVNGLGPGIGASISTVDSFGAIVNKLGVRYDPWLTAAQPLECPPSPQATIGDFVWVDANANGIQDAGEAGLGDVTVQLYTCDGTLFREMVTGNDGYYSFSVNPGDYYVKVVVPAGYSVSPKNVGGNPGADSDIERSGQMACTQLDANEQDLSWDAGLYKKATLGDFVWLDGNGNGIQNSGELGVSGVKVDLYTCGGTFVATTNTDVNGKYSFTVDPGTYYVQFNLPPGYSFTGLNLGGNTSTDSDAITTSGRTACLTLTSGQTDLTWDAGLNQPTPCDERSIASNFNGTKIDANRYIWFNAVLKPSGLGSGPTTIYVRGGHINFSIGSTNYVLPVPDADITYSSAYSSASTTFDSANNKWITRLPLNYSKNAFLAGLSYKVPVNFPGGINPVTWYATFTTDRSGVTMDWKWAAAVYKTFSSNHGALGVKPVDDSKNNPYQNSDHAGTPENYKSSVIGGARGGGGSNYTGSYSSTKSVGPCVTSGSTSGFEPWVPGSPSGTGVVDPWLDTSP